MTKTKKPYIFDEWVVNPILFIIGIGIWVYAIIDTTMKTALIFTISVLFMLWSITFSDKNKKKYGRGYLQKKK